MIPMQYMLVVVCKMYAAGPSLSNHGPRPSIGLGAPPSLFFCLKTRFFFLFLKKKLIFPLSWVPFSLGPLAVARWKRRACVRGVFFYVTRSVLDLIDHSVPALANCSGTERWDRTTGPEGLVQNVQDHISLIFKTIQYHCAIYSGR